MATVTSPGPLSTKPLARLRETAEETSLSRSVGVLGLVLYAAYGYRHSHLRREA
jgi:hypothetical protein